MKCINPITIYYDYEYNRVKVNKYSLPLMREKLRAVEVGCGKCHACMSQKASEITMRVQHEAMFYDYGRNAVFLTLTYNDETRPSDCSLVLSDFQKFMKRLRKQCDRQGIKLKYFACGEYGKKTKRPHYHAILFGLSYFNSSHKQLINKCWQKGFTYFGTVTDKSISYCAKYMLKQSDTFQTGKYDLKKYREHVYQDLVASGVDKIVARYRANNVKINFKDYYYLKHKKLAPFRVWSKGLGQRYCLSFAENIIDNLNINDHSIPRTYLKWIYKKLNVDIHKKLDDKLIEVRKKLFNEYLDKYNISIDDLKVKHNFVVKDSDMYKLNAYSNFDDILIKERDERLHIYKVKFDDYMLKLLYQKKSLISLECA